MKTMHTYPTLLGLLLAVGCSDTGPGTVIVDAMAADPTDAAAVVDAAEEPQPVRVPIWALEDIQPGSPGFGTTYGLDAFADQILVVALLEGF